MKKYTKYIVGVLILIINTIFILQNAGIAYFSGYCADDRHFSIFCGEFFVQNGIIIFLTSVFLSLLLTILYLKMLLSKK